MWLSRLKVLPLLVVIAALSFGLRLGDFVNGLDGQKIPITAGQALAEDAKPAEPVALGEPPPVPSSPMIEEPRTAGIPEKPPLTEGEDVTGAWRDASDTDMELSSVRMELFEDLKNRRAILEKREQELSIREALQKAAEQELEQKYEELVSLRSEIKDLLKEQSEEEKGRITSLVKIYEGMKPKDAARIFNTLDLDVLLQVVGKMSERKSAPIIAAMEAERARTLTIMLMEQKKLPGLANDLMAQ